MWCTRVFLLLVATLGFAEVDISATGNIYLTIAYCPGNFNGAGAIVEVNPTNGAWTIIGKFTWGQATFGCDILYDPIITLDRTTGLLYMDFTEDAGYIVTLDIQKAKVVRGVNSGDIWFTGFENMGYRDDTSLLQGISMTVTENGFCFDGCIQFGQLTPTNGKYKSTQNLPFKAIMDDSHYLDTTSNTYYVQASYDLRAKPCAPAQSDECMLAIDTTTGSLTSAIWTNYTVYKYAQQTDSSGNILAWVYGFEGQCKNPYDDYAFATVNLPTAKATLLKCIQHNIIVVMDEWISSFSNDDTLFATGSGDAESGVPQLLVFDVATGQATVNTTLPGLDKALGANMGLFDIWSVDFM